MKAFTTFSAGLKAAFCALSLSAVIAGCDVIKGDYKDPAPGNGNGPDTTQTDTTAAVRRVFLEEYTGHKCGFCPEGNDLAHDLQNIYGNRLVIMSVHAGTFAKVNTPAQIRFQYDFNSNVGEAMNTHYAVEAAGYPSASVNRVNDRVYGKAQWATIIDTVLQRAPQAKIKITPTVNATTRQLNVAVKTTFVQAMSRPQNISVYLVETDKTEWQKDYRINISDKDIPNYKHKDFLRHSLTSTWGDVLTTGPVAANYATTKNFSMQVPAEYDLSKCRIIATVNDPVTYRITEVNQTGPLQP